MRAETPAEWMQRANRGTCGGTEAGVRGDCEAGDKGALTVTSQWQTLTWYEAVKGCLALCAGCSRCSICS